MALSSLRSADASPELVFFAMAPTVSLFEKKQKKKIRPPSVGWDQGGLAGRDVGDGDASGLLQGGLSGQVVWIPNHLLSPAPGFPSPAAVTRGHTLISGHFPQAGSLGVARRPSKLNRIGPWNRALLYVAIPSSNASPSPLGPRWAPQVFARRPPLLGLRFLLHPTGHRWESSTRGVESAASTGSGSWFRRRPEFGWSPRIVPSLHKRIHNTPASPSAQEASPASPLGGPSPP